MAAVDPSESPKRQKSPAEEVETSGETEAVESECGLNLTDEATHNKTCPDDEQGARVGNDGGGGGVSVGVASHSEVSVESGAGAEKTTCSSPEGLASAAKMAEASGGDQRTFDWSEPEDNEQEKTHQEENDLKSVPEGAGGVQQDPHVDDDITDDAAEVPEEDTSHPAEGSSEKEAEAEAGAEAEAEAGAEAGAGKQVGEVDELEEAVEDDEEVDRVEDANLTPKPKQCRLVCKECGKKFTRRETFNLHRHFHAHEDELTPLTCKECGLTFQHRSSLIKHRNEHKEKEEQLVSPKKEGRFKCAECGMIFFNVDKLRDHSCYSVADKPYHCPLCRQEFQFKFAVTKHMRFHSSECNLTCQECNQTFPDSMALRCHQRCHTALKPYECPECGLVFKHYSVMEDHRRKHTDNMRSHLCNICGKTFKYSSLLHQHQYLHTGQKPFRCPECGKKFAFAQNMKAHCRQHRLCKTNSSTEQPGRQTPASKQEPVKGPGKENTHQSEDPKRSFNCPLCPQTYLVPANLRAHMLIHETEYETTEKLTKFSKENNKQWDKGHSCPHCPCVYRDESSLNMHLFSVHKTIVQQPLVKEAVPLKNQFRCSECGKSFRHRSVLELHMRIHSKDKPYQCKVCCKSFRFGSYLQQHLIIHTGKKPYKCPDCGKDFAFLQNMRTHQKLHQEKPFRCTSCRKGYSNETQLQQHMLSHNGDKPHKCDLCDKSFGLAYLLRDHMNTHTGDRPHRCDECGKTFSWFSSLLVHQKIHARKRQGYSQYNSFPMGARMRGRGNRGRRGGRLSLGWSRPLGSSGMISSQQSPYPVSAQRDAEMNRRAAQPQSSMLSPRMDVKAGQQKEPWLSEQHSQPVQWKVDGGEVMPVPSSQQQQHHAAPQQTPPQPSPQQHQRSAGWTDNTLITQSGQTPAQSSESSHMKESTTSSFMTAAPKKPSPSTMSDMEQHRQPRPVTWSSTPTTTVLCTTSSLPHDFPAPPSYIDGAALWSIRPSLLANSQSSPNKLGQELQLPRWAGAPVSIQKQPSTPPKKEDTTAWNMGSPQVITSTVSQPEKPWNGCELQKPWVSGLPSVSSSAQIDQSGAMPISTPVSHGVGSTLWDIQTPPGLPKTINPEKLVNTQNFQLQQKQASPAWASVPTAAQKVPISIQYEPHRFGQGLGTPVWGFQSNQTLLTGQLKPGNGQELQQQPMVTGTQIIINQPSPFFSPPLAPLPPLALPGPHPLHSVAVGTLSRPPHPNMFFSPQAVMSERPHITPTMSLPQLPPRTEPHKLGSRLPFAPERLLQCMICGCSLPRELDLQMHYLQHAQGEI